VSEVSLQELYWPEGICWGCGPQNSAGLRLRSFTEGSLVVAEWQPRPVHQAFPGILNGGIIGTLLDCHSNMGAFIALREQDGASEPTVTLEYNIKLLAPTPIDQPVRLIAEPLEVRDRSVRVRATMHSGATETATCEGVFLRPRAR
jgi:acyl-coenzyme A thioesterase PaaI-like protein